MEAIIRVYKSTRVCQPSHDELKKLDDYSQKVRVLRLTLERRPLGPPSVRVFGPGGEVLDKVLAALPEGPMRQVLNRNFPPNPRPNQPDPRGGMLMW